MSRLIEKGSESSWAHFEVVAKGGWFRNLLHGKQPWVEIGYLNAQALQLNPGISKSKRAMVEVPKKWQRKKKSQFSVPTTDVLELSKWIEDCLEFASGESNYRVSGWIEGF